MGMQALVNHASPPNQTARWTGGIINNRYLFDVLHENGAGDVALQMLQGKEYPSYGYMYFNALEPAKECMWELPDAPFQGTGMNSRNHHMFSSVGHYLVKYVAGLSVDFFEGRLTAVVGALPKSSVTRRSSRGASTFSWERGQRLHVDITVPITLKAELHVPVEDGALLAGEGLSSLYRVEDVSLFGGRAYRRLHLPSGRHSLVFHAESTELVV